MFRLVCGFLFLSLANATVYFSEDFPTKDSLSEWTESSHHAVEKRGTWSISSSPPWDQNELGLKTETDSRFYALSKRFKEPFSNKGKTLVIQYLVKHEKSVTCGGSYLKLLPYDTELHTFHGETPYLFMFGPDICGYSTKKVHAIFNYKGKNHLIKKDVTCKDDLHSHLYTFILTPDNKYKILIDNEKEAEGSLEDDWDMLPPKQIDDPEAKKPEDWVDESEIVDETDEKPEDWDQPKTIPDPNAKKPEDWDDEMDGDWEKPQIDNPDFKGEWEPKKIPNPAYKGPWVAPKIDNPEYKLDEDLYVMNAIGTIGFDLWKVDAGSIFDNILITDDPEFAKTEGEKKWRPRYDADVAKQKADEEEAKKKEDEEAKKEKDGGEQKDDDKASEVEDLDAEADEPSKEVAPEEEKPESHEEL